MKKNLKTGKFGEKLAAEFLLKKGIQVIKRNYRYDRAEVDLIALDGDELVFVEVKTRRNKNYGSPENAVNQSKLNKINKVAENFISEFGDKLNFNSVRIDVISILFTCGKYEIEHFENVTVWS